MLQNKSEINLEESELPSVKSACVGLSKVFQIIVVGDVAPSHGFKVGGFDLAVDKYASVLLHIAGKEYECQLGSAGDE